jgi:carbonic anhydrase
MPTPIDRMIAGFRGFRSHYYDRHPERLAELASQGQRPQVLLIACADSRVDPAILTRSEPGEIFVVRNVANLVPPYEPDGRYHDTCAAVEYAVRHLRVEHIVVCGHSCCGGIQALMDQARGLPDEHDFIAPWMNLAAGSCGPLVAELVGGGTIESATFEQAAICGSLNNLLGFPWVRDRVEAGDLTLHGWWFELHKGELWHHNDSTGRFDPLA